MPAVPQATAAVVSAWQDAVNAYAAFAVAGDATYQGQPIMAEYVVSTPLTDSKGAAKSVAQLKSELVANASAQRGAQKVGPVAVAITGSVSL